MKIYLSAVTGLLTVLLLGGCGGQIAKTGWTTVTGVSHDGVMRLGYPDGTAALKRINPDTVRKSSRTAAENLLRPARYVETDQGSTLTFPCGDTLIYYDLKCD
ncbi:MAG: hypothetical protein P8182_18885 [Deltaproteobacteria bacterium]